MQAIYRLLFRKIVIVTHILLKRCSTIKIHNFLRLSSEKPSVALLSSHFNTLFSFQGASVVNTNFISFASTCWLKLTHSVVSPLRLTNRLRLGLRAEFGLTPGH